MNIYRARIGRFYSRSTRNPKVPFIDCVTKFYSLLFLTNNFINLAVFVSIVLINIDEKFLSYKKNRSATHFNNKNPDEKHNPQENNYFITIVSKILLLLSGNVETNPGPNVSQNDNDFKIIHINCQSLSEEKKPMLEAISNQFDIITCSETWFRNDFSDTRVHLSGFHKPVMRNRVSGLGGGVAIFVRSDLHFKTRFDIGVENLESVWIETQINQES